MATKRKKSAYIEKFLRTADKAIDKGIKKADEVIEDAVEFGLLTKSQAHKKSKELRKHAKKHGESLRKQGIQKITEGISSAKNIRVSANDELETLEKLAKLRKSGIITEKEFQEKKKKILARI